MKQRDIIVTVDNLTKKNADLLTSIPEFKLINPQKDLQGLKESMSLYNRIQQNIIQLAIIAEITAGGDIAVEEILTRIITSTAELSKQLEKG